MKRNFYINVVFIILVLTVAVICWRRLSRSGITYSPTSSKSAKSQITGHQLPLYASGQNSTPSPKSSLLTPAEAIQMKAQEVKREEQVWNLALLTPISFYGKVIDHEGNPIANADIAVSYADKVWDGDSRATASSDNNGLFHISGHGLSVDISVSKTGYYRTKRSDGSFVYADGAGRRNTSSNPADPVIFTLQKIGATESLISGKQRAYRINKDGTPVGLNLMTGKVAQGEGDIIVQAWTNDADRQVNTQHAYDWHCRVTVPGGGLVERTDNSQYEAPMSGYATMDDISMPAAMKQNWRSQVSKEYFLELGNHTYARMMFKMVSSDDHFFVVSYFLNPKNGSRNLNYDPMQAVSRP